MPTLKQQKFWLELDEKLDPNVVDLLVDLSHAARKFRAMYKDDYTKEPMRTIMRAEFTFLLSLRTKDRVKKALKSLGYNEYGLRR